MTALTCNPQPSGKPAIVHLPKAVHARTSIVCVSSQANKVAQANKESVIRLTRGAEVIESAAGKERPWSGRIAPGDWDVEVTFTTLPEFKKHETVLSPVCEVEVQV